MVQGIVPGFWGVMHWIVTPYTPLIEIMKIFDQVFEEKKSRVDETVEMECEGETATVYWTLESWTS